MALLVRDAAPSDAGDVSRLLRELGYPVEPDEVRDRLATQTGASDVLVAVDEDALVGVIACSRAVPLLAEGGGLVRITALAVTAGVRRGGVGRALVEEVERRAGARGASLLEVSSGRRPERAAAHGFYQALGFADAADRSVVYRKPLGTESREPA